MYYSAADCIYADNYMSIKFVPSYALLYVGIHTVHWLLENIFIQKTEMFILKYIHSFWKERTKVLQATIHGLVFKHLQSLTKPLF